jgi:hypothetical protein
MKTICDVVVVCRLCQQKNRVQMTNVLRAHNCGRCKTRLVPRDISCALADALLDGPAVLAQGTPTVH